MHNVGWEFTLIIFHNGVFCFYTDESHYLVPMVPQYWLEGEIIGNIHDNPELIKTEDLTSLSTMS
ncbi:MAG: hypothetical protein EPN37_07125 [Chitinophagaceae bacterium]|nr:MAG: hypothetical protein EPN37_07125 [Chitinophagaceae bacterium]